MIKNILFELTRGRHILGGLAAIAALNAGGNIINSYREDDLDKHEGQEIRDSTNRANEALEKKHQELYKKQYEDLQKKSESLRKRHEENLNYITRMYKPDLDQKYSSQTYGSEFLNMPVDSDSKTRFDSLSNEEKNNPSVYAQKNINPKFYKEHTDKLYQEERDKINAAEKISRSNVDKQVNERLQNTENIINQKKDELIAPGQRLMRYGTLGIAGLKGIDMLKDKIQNRKRNNIAR
jgi:hypothetical protein